MPQIDWTKATFWERVEGTPPMLMRLMAREPWKPAMTHAQVAERSGLSVAAVAAISRQIDWVGVDIPTARRFMKGCGCDLCNPLHVRRLRDYFRWVNKRPVHRRFRFIWDCPTFETELRPLYDLWQKHLKGIAQPKPPSVAAK